MIRVIKFIAVTLAAWACAPVFAGTACENQAKTRDDFLACSRADTEKTLSDARKLYEGIRKLAPEDKQAALDKNFAIWKDKMTSDCALIAYSFNGWSNDYTPDTDFQTTACREKLASQELDFYKWLACPESMENSKVPDCPAISRMIKEN